MENNTEKKQLERIDDLIDRQLSFIERTPTVDNVDVLIKLIQVRNDYKKIVIENTPVNYEWMKPSLADRTRKSAVDFICGRRESKWQ